MLCNKQKGIKCKLFFIFFLFLFSKKSKKIISFNLNSIRLNKSNWNKMFLFGLQKKKKKNHFFSNRFVLNFSFTSFNLTTKKRYSWKLMKDFFFQKQPRRMSQSYSVRSSSATAQWSDTLSRVFDGKKRKTNHNKQINNHPETTFKRMTFVVFVCACAKIQMNSFLFFFFCFRLVFFVRSQK